MDAIELIDEERGDWIFIERSAKFLMKWAKELGPEIIDANNGGMISDETFKMMKPYADLTE